VAFLQLCLLVQLPLSFIQMATQVPPHVSHVDVNLGTRGGELNSCGYKVKHYYKNFARQPDANFPGHKKVETEGQIPLPNSDLF